jgi:hypothetical protein
MSAETVTASDGTQLDLNSLAQTFTYSGANIATITVTYPSLQTGMPRNFVQTFTYSGANVTNISGWIAQ